jgi:hypothetical protein
MIESPITATLTVGSALPANTGLTTLEPELAEGCEATVDDVTELVVELVVATVFAVVSEGDGVVGTV